MGMPVWMADWADEKYGEFLVLAELHRERMASAKPGLTGYVSDCCRAEVRVTAAGQFFCEKCNKSCDPSSWWALDSTSSRGGWTPGIAETELVWDRERGCHVEVDTGRTWNVMYVNETRSRNTGAVEDRMIGGVEAIKRVNYLFARPVGEKGMTAAYWERIKIAWQIFLARQSFVEVASLAVAHGRDPELWSPAAVEDWVEHGREKAWDRFRAARDKRLGWAVAEGKTLDAQRKAETRGRRRAAEAA